MCVHEHVCTDLCMYVRVFNESRRTLEGEEGVQKEVKGTREGHGGG